MVLSEIKCRNCGAQVAFDADRQVVKCPFCGSEYVVEVAATQNTVTLDLPQAQIVPVAVDDQKAHRIFLRWLSEGFWKPNDLAHAFKKDGSTMVYVPFWVFNADVDTTWNGFYGQKQYRTVTKTRRVYNNGRSFDEHYVDSEPYTVWFPQSGEHSANYGDFISASGALNQTEADKLRFNGKDFKPLQNEYLHGWQSERPAVSEQQAAKISQGRMLDWEGKACRRLTDRLERWTSQFTFRSYFLVYFPIWTFAYKYNKTSYRAIINGKTGEIFGRKPVSQNKVIIAVAAVVLLLIGIGIAFNLGSQ